VCEAWAGVNWELGGSEESKISLLTFAVRNGISDTLTPCGGLQQEARVAVL